MSERIIPRRDVLQLLANLGKLALVYPLAQSLLAGCQPGKPKNEIDKESIPEFILPINGNVREIEDVASSSTADVGISTLRIYSAGSKNQTYVFSEFEEDVSIIKNLGDIPPEQRKDGFVPYDPSFNVEEALRKLQQQYQIFGPPSPQGRDLVSIHMTFRGLMRNMGVYAFYNTPPINTDVMYILGLQDLYTVDGQKPPLAILKAKLRFVDSDNTK